MAVVVVVAAVLVVVVVLVVLAVLVVLVLLVMVAVRVDHVRQKDPMGVGPSRRPGWRACW